MGPCRITPTSKTGICGLSPDAMVARNLLRETVGGAAGHVGHARHLLLTLRDALNGDAPMNSVVRTRRSRWVNCLACQRKAGPRRMFAAIW